MRYSVKWPKFSLIGLVHKLANFASDESDLRTSQAHTFLTIMITLVPNGAVSQDASSR